MWSPVLKKRWRCLVDQLGVGWCDGLVSDFGALGGVMVVSSSHEAFDREFSELVNSNSVMSERWSEGITGFGNPGHFFSQASSMPPNTPSVFKWGEW